MPSTPPPPPEAQASAEAWQRWRLEMRRRDREALTVRRGKHPAVWRRQDLPAAVHWQRLAAAAPPQQVLKEGKRSRVVRLRGEGGEAFILKQYRPTRRLDPRDGLGFSKAMRSLLAAEALARRGFDIAQPYACWSASDQGSWLLLQALDDCLPCHEAVVAVRGAERRELLTALAHTLRRLHRAGVAYRDLKPSNLMVSTAPWRFHFVDHDRNRFSRREVPRRLALRDLAALHAGLPPEVRASERLRALAAYDAGLLEREAWRRWLPPLLEEAAARRHRWRAPRLLGGRA